MKKRILIISGIVGSGWLAGKASGSQAFPQTIMGYAQKGWDVFLLAGFQARDQKEYSLSQKIKIIQFTNNRIRNFLLNTSPHFIFRNIWWVYFQISAFSRGFSIAKKEKPDIFYGYEIHAIPVAKILSFLFKKPVIFRYQGTKVPFYKKQKFWKIRYFSHVLAMKLKANLYIMANDGTTGKAVLEEMGIHPSKIKFWTNGVEKDIFEISSSEIETKNSLGFKKDDKVIMSVSRLEKWKGIERTIMSLPAIVKQYPKVFYLIIGWGSEKENLEKLVKKLNLEDYIKFVGMVQHHKLKDYYNICDVFVSMYDISNVGNPLLEAMAQNKCIVTLDIGDTNKFIKNNKNGVLLQPKEINKLPSAIIDLLKDEEKRKRLGEEAKKFARENFWTWEERIKIETSEVEKLIKVS